MKIYILLKEVSMPVWVLLAFSAYGLYLCLYRWFVSGSLARRHRLEEQRAAGNEIAGAEIALHPAIVAIHKWAENPGAPPERAYRWLDGHINAVFGRLISQGELLRALCLNVSFGGTILAFLVATSGGHDLKEMFREFSGALGMTLSALLLVTIESWTLSRLSTEAAHLEFHGREMLDLWASQHPAQEMENETRWSENPSRTELQDAHSK